MIGSRAVFALITCLIPSMATAAQAYIYKNFGDWQVAYSIGKHQNTCLIETPERSTGQIGFSLWGPANKWATTEVVVSVPGLLQAARTGVGSIKLEGTSVRFKKIRWVAISETAILFVLPRTAFIDMFSARSVTIEVNHKSFSMPAGPPAEAMKAYEACVLEKVLRGKAGSV